ncbi:MAG: hypothetical protein AAF296_12275 [Pseudomonadota bacterium]
MRGYTSTLAVICGAAFLTSSCSQTGSPSSPHQNTATQAETANAEVTPKRVRLGSPITTIKPGAGVIVDATVPATLEVGESATVIVSVSEAFSEGTLVITSSGSEGLTIFGAETTARLDMGLEGPHQVRLDYTADAAGVYYLNIVATTISADGNEDSRAHAIRVEIGDWETAAKVSQNAVMEVSPQGDAMIIMEAEETIE